MKIELEIPGKTLDESYIKEALASILYHEQRISGAQARRLAGVSRRNFGDLLAKFGYSELSDDPETIQDELNVNLG